MPEGARDETAGGVSGGSSGRCGSADIKKEQKIRKFLLLKGLQGQIMQRRCLKQRQNESDR